MSKLINGYNLKSLTEIKDISLGKREVAMYLSKFDVLDSDKDIIKKGAFARSLKDRGVDSPSNRKIAFLRHHDWQQQIGKWLKLEEDDLGLFAVGKLGTSTMGEDALRDYEEGIIKEHSIGFQYMTDNVRKVDNADGSYYYEIFEVKLYEGSAVTFGANEFTEVLAIGKSENKVQLVEKLSKEIDVITKALINGRGTDERLYNLEMKLKYLNSRLIDLAMMPSVQSSKAQAEQIDNKPNFDWNKLNKLL
jgi:HK97 family phage prohead protease